MAAIVPPQSIAPSDTAPDLFNKTWWLAFTQLEALLHKALGGGGYFEVPTVTIAGPSYTASPDLTQGETQNVTLSQGLTAIQSPAAPASGTLWALVIAQDASGGRAVTLDAGYAGNAVIPGMLLTTANTYSALSFLVRPDGQNALLSIATGLPL